ncbi:hypothetical protein C8R45DRAFT_980755 [Mycena sanguinolenta]|nr:hypothetical protein C8R45DRAFT_980755 [Mycena sanguinolenta]
MELNSEDLVAPPPKALPANPQLRRIPATAAPSTISAYATTTFSEKQVRNQLLYRQQFCAVTGSAAASLEACHILNAVRKRKSENKEQAKDRKIAWETYLTDLGLNGGAPFSLNSVFNEILAKRDIHHPWNKSGSICFCPPSNVIVALTATFKRANDLWSAQGAAARVLTASPLFGSFNCNVFVLNRNAVFPCGEPLLVQTNPNISTSSQQSSVQHPVWNQYIYDEQTGHLVCDGQGHLNLRMWSDPVSTIAVVLNASVKLSHAIAAARDKIEEGWVVPPSLHILNAQIQEFLVQLYFTPRAATRTDEEEYNAAHMPQNQDDSTFQPKSGNVGYELTPQEALETEDREEDDDDLEEEDDNEQPLTLEEMDLGLEKLRDPSVAIADKIEIGADVRPSPLPLQLLPFLT